MIPVKPAATGTIAVVTPSFVPDLHRCELLAESLDIVAPKVPHYIIVDDRDRAAFRHLAGRDRHIIISEDLLRRRLWRVPGNMGVLISWKAMPVRGWMFQQIKKIAAADLVPEETLIFCDSDYAFFRPFDRSDLLVDGKMGLFDIAFTNKEILNWTKSARELLGLPQRDTDFHGHIGSMICWNREIVTAMRQRIEAVTSQDWQLAMAKQLTLSEYTLYGVYVREFLGYGASCHNPSTVPLVKMAWLEHLSTDEDVQNFLKALDPRTVAIMAHSKGPANLALVRKHLTPFWRQAEMQH